MWKKLIAGLLAMLLTTVPALAEVYTGVTAAAHSLQISAPSGGILETLYAGPGSAVTEGETLAQIRTTKVFANQDGIIARIDSKENTSVNGTILELQPVCRYTIHCTAEDAYDLPENHLVHSGEELYIHCTYNGTHRGTGRITSIDGNNFMLETTGGELYVGETVYLYRDADFSAEQRVGIGTVVIANPEVYEAEGKLIKLHVSEGEYVQCGELLYETIDGESDKITAPVSGIITACEIAEGDKLEKDQLILTIVPYDAIGVQIHVDEKDAGIISSGEQITIAYACDAESATVSGKIEHISYTAENNTYTVTISPESVPQYLGMSVEVRVDE